MKFNLKDDGLEITAAILETPGLFEFFHGRINGVEDARKLIEALDEDPYTILCPNGKRPWFHVDVSLPAALAPYYKYLKELTGYEGPIPDVNLINLYPSRLCATHVTEAIGTEQSVLKASVYIQSEDWNGKPAAARAIENAHDYVQERVGRRKFEHEFIGNDNGTYRRNPDYLKRYAAEPACTAEWLWSWLFSWWRADAASQKQKELLAAVVSNITVGCCSDYKHDLYIADPNGKCDWDGKGFMARRYTWDEFAKLR